jgi:hypothetical protein
VTGKPLLPEQSKTIRLVLKSKNSLRLFFFFTPNHGFLRYQAGEMNI